MYLKLIKLDTVDSTNDYAGELARDGAREITIVAARGQRKGKGRFGRHWCSPKDKGIYLSFILRPSNRVEDIYYLPLVFSVAVACVLKEIIAVTIKLPNDIMVANKKLGGILVEAKTSGQKIDYVIVGVGINVTTTKAFLPLHATSLYIETDVKHPLERLAKKIIESSLNHYRRFKLGDIDYFLKETIQYHKENTPEKIKQAYLRSSSVPQVMSIG